MYISKKMLLVILGIALLASSAALAFAQESDDNLIHSCVNNSSGTIKIVAPDEECANNEVPLDWNPNASVGGNAGGVFLARGNAVSHLIRCASFTGGDSSCAPQDYGQTVVPLPKNGNLVSMVVNVYYNTLTDSYAEVTVMVNDTETALKIHVPAGSTGVYTSHIDVPVHTGDLIYMQGDGTAATDGGIQYAVTVLYETE